MSRAGGFDGAATMLVQLESGTSYAILINTSIGGPDYGPLIGDMNKCCTPTATDRSAQLVPRQAKAGQVFFEPVGVVRLGLGVARDAI